MNIARVMVCCTLLLAASCFSQTASGQDLPGVANVSAFDGIGYSNPWGTRSGFREEVGDGRGWDDGSHTFFIRQPFSIVPEELVLFGEARGFVPYTGDFGANLGAGLRYFDPNYGVVYGVNAWYDHDVSSLRDNQNFREYDQLGAGFEILSPYLDFRANAYIPTTDEPGTISRTFQGLAFSGFSLVGAFDRLTETAMKGGDFEIGGANVIPSLGDWGIRPYIGAYYFEGKGESSAVGTKARAEVLVTQNFAVEANVMNDRLWGTHIGGAATLTFGSGQAPQWFTRQRQVDRLYAQVERQYRISTHRQQTREVDQAVDANGNPFFVFHIDNTAAPGGDGSSAAPLNFLPTSVPDNFGIIFVRRGDGTNNGQTGGITLFDNQRFLGEGALHLVNTQFGILPLPGTPGPFPTISNLFAGAAVTLANNNEVAGFNIVDSVGPGISGTNITNFNINRINARGNTQGILLTNASGTGIIRNSTFNSNLQGGVVINNTATPDLNLFINEIQVANSTNGPGIELTAMTNTNIFGQIANSSSQGSQAGLYLESADNSGIDILSTTNVYSNNVGDSITTGSGVSIAVDGSFVNYTSLGDLVLNNQSHGMTSSVVNGGTLSLNFLASNGYNLNGRNGFNSVVNNSTLNLSVQGNTTFNGNGQTGVQALLANNSVINFGFDGSAATANGAHGIGLVADASTINAQVTNSTLSTLR